MGEGKRCLLIYPDGTQEIVYKNIRSPSWEVNELQKHLNKINIPVRNMFGSCWSEDTYTYDPYILTCYCTGYLNNPINMTPGLYKCNCKIKENHYFHGVVGIAKYMEKKIAIYPYIEKIQVDY